MPAEFRLVHCADVHLDTPYHSRSADLRKRLTEAGRAAFTALIDLCLAEDVHALLIAGDLFDNDRLSFATEGFLTKELERVTAAGCHVVIVTGNHDPGRATATNRAHAIAWPTERCTLLRSNVPEIVDIFDAAGQIVGRVVGAGHQTSRDTVNLAEKYPDPPGPEPAVGILHTQVQGSVGAENHQPYAPCTPDHLAARRVGYWALGHVHGRQQVLADPPAWYCGNLQGRSFRETGAKGALLVSVPRHGGARVEFRPLAPLRFETLVLNDLQLVTNLNELLGLVRSRFGDLTAAADVLPEQEWLLRVLLEGPCPLVDTLRREDARADLAAEIEELPGVLHAEVRTRRVSRPVDLSEHRGQPHVLGLALEVLELIRSDDLILDHVAPEVLAGNDDDPDSPECYAYLRSLLDGMETELAENLLQEPSA